MKIAILADVHANLRALEAVLADLEEVQPDCVVVNGDMVNRGPSSPQVIERLWDRPNFWFTLGNHDDLLLGWNTQNPAFSDTFAEPLFASMGWAAAQLNTEHLRWISNLPYQVGQYPNHKLFSLDKGEGMGEALELRITHGSPRHYREGYDEYQSLEVLGEISQDYPARLLVGSHTHRPFMYQLGNSLILNSGAVGAPFNGDTRSQYVVVEMGQNHIQVDFRQIPYNLEAALRDFHTSGMLSDGGLGAELFYLELQTGRSFLTPFFLWANQQKLPKDRSAWAMFRQAFPERFAGVLA